MPNEFTTRYAMRGESQDAVLHRVAGTLATDDAHFTKLHDLLRTGRFWPSGRILASVGTAKQTTPVACFASGPIDDTIDGIMLRAHEAAETMRMTGSMGYDFSTLRPASAPTSRGSGAAGPVGFMQIFDAVGAVIRSTQHRNTVQMGVLRIDHPDIETFIQSDYPTFHTAVAVTDEFMQSLMEKRLFALRFNGTTWAMVDPAVLWETLMRRIYTSGGPRVLFIDRINRLNALACCETITTANPWMEQPLPHWGSCPLGTFNVAEGMPSDDEVATAVEAMDNLIDKATYPLPQQAIVARSTRRIGLGVMGLGEIYSRQEDFEVGLDDVLSILRSAARKASVALAEVRGPYPMHPAGILTQRNSHLLSLAPTAGISEAAGVSPGILGPSLRPMDQLELLGIASKHVDGGIAYTVMVPQASPWSEFKNLFLAAHAMGLKSLHVETF